MSSLLYVSPDGALNQFKTKTRPEQGTENSQNGLMMIAANAGSLRSLAIKP